MKQTVQARISRRISRARRFCRSRGFRRATKGARNFRPRVRASLLGALVLFVAGAGVAVGCGWVGTEHSVRFNGWLKEKDFSRLPPLPFSARVKTKEPHAPGEEEAEASYERRERLAKELDALWHRAGEAAKGGEPEAARKLLKEYLGSDGVDGCGAKERWLAGECVTNRRNSAADQLDALASLEKGAGVEPVRAYLSARRLYDFWMDAPRLDRAPAGPADAGAEEEKAEVEEGEPAPVEGQHSKADEVRAALERVPRHAGLEDNVEYLRAAVLYREDETEEAVLAFGRLVARHPRSEKREAALYMVGLLNLKRSRSYTGEHAAAEGACPDCRDDAWQASSDAFRRLLSEYPRGRFAPDARGWLGYLRLRVGETAEGLAEYYRLLADERDEAARAEGLISLRLARGVAGESDMKRLEAAIAVEPRVALAYAYHEIYNYTLPDGPYIEVPEEGNPYGHYKDDYASPYYQKYHEWADGERERLRRTEEGKALGRVADFATRMMRRYPRAEVGGGFALRVAEAQLELGEEKAAHGLARRALALGVAGDERAAALWVKGVAEQRLKDFVASRRTLSALVAEFPSGDLTEGARRLLAIAAEDAGDLDAALEQYIALDYATDVAYFVDVLLTPEQLGAFISRRPHVPQRQMLLYSLGLRYLRLRRFGEARAAYAQVRTEDATEPGWGDSHSERCLEGVRPSARCDDPKGPDYETKAGVVLRRWLRRDLKTMEEIEHLEAEVARARDDESSAEALYQLASYFYESGELTFYNPAAWRGQRGGSFYYAHTMRAPDEEQSMRRYMEGHEPLVPALKLYLEAARLYPRTRAARDALYTAAVVHERLAGSQWYWPMQYGEGLFPGERLVTYADVRREYPRYQLPRGTLGWEPRTRTVGGGPGWDEAPARQPPTRIERARRRVKRAEALALDAWRLFGEVSGGRPRRWSLVLLASAGLLLVWRATRRSRAVLAGQLARFSRRDPRTPEVMPRPASSFAAREPYTLGARARAGAGGAWRVLWEVLLDRRGRAALMLNFLTHGVFTVLLWALTWALRSG